MQRGARRALTGLLLAAAVAVGHSAQTGDTPPSTLTVEHEGAAWSPAPSPLAREAPRPQGFVPPSVVEGERAVIPVAFPSGVRLELVVSTAAGLHELPVTPLALVGRTPQDPADLPPSQTMTWLELHPGSPHGVMSRRNWFARPEEAVERPAGVIQWEREGRPRELTARLEGWTAVVKAHGWRGADDQPDGRAEVRAAVTRQVADWAAHTPTRTADGFPLLLLRPPIFLEAEALVFRDRSGTHPLQYLDRWFIVELVDGETCAEDRHTAPMRPRAAVLAFGVQRWCAPGTAVSFALPGVVDAAFRDALLDLVEVRRITPEPRPPTGISGDDHGQRGETGGVGYPPM